MKSNNKTEHTEAITSLMRELVSAIVDDRSAVSVHATRFEDEVSLQLKVAPEDIARLIGEQRRTFQALQTILAPPAQNIINALHSISSSSTKRG